MQAHGRATETRSHLSAAEAAKSNAAPTDPTPSEYAIGNAEQFTLAVALACNGDEGALENLMEDMGFVQALALAAASKTLDPLQALMQVWPDAFTERAASFQKKLTDDQVREMRGRFERGHKLKLLASTYGVSMSVASYIVNRKTYKDVA